MRDLIIESTAVPIAARDYGGDGAPVLLLHGAGASLPSMTGLAESLRPTYRVVAVDLRGHGRSGDGPWDWDGVLADLAGVAKELDLVAPAVVGLSLGGMLAALWAQRHPECPAAVSLDGNPTPSRPEQLSGMDPDRAAVELDRLHEMFAAMSAAMAGPLSAELTEQLRVALTELELLPAYREARCPLLLVLATEDLPEQRQFAALYAAYRRGLVEQLTLVAQDNPRVRVARLPGASHAMLAERPKEVAELVADFLATARPSDH